MAASLSWSFALRLESAYTYLAYIFPPSTAQRRADQHASQDLENAELVEIAFEAVVSHGVRHSPGLFVENVLFFTVTY